MRNAEYGMKDGKKALHSAFRIPHSAFLAAFLV